MMAVLNPHQDSGMVLNEICDGKLPEANMCPQRLLLPSHCYHRRLFYHAKEIRT